MWTPRSVLAVSLLFGAWAGDARAVPVTISAVAPGTTRVVPGQAVVAGITFWLPRPHEHDAVSVSGASIAVSGRCANGARRTLTISLATAPSELPGSETQTFERLVRAPSSLCRGAPLRVATATFVGDVESTLPGTLRVAFHYGSALASARVSVLSGPVRAAPRASEQAAPPSTVPGLRIATKQTMIQHTRVDYRITVTNTSRSALAVVVADPRCDAGTLSPFGPQPIFPGSSLAWECWHVLHSSTSAFSNTALAVGTAADGTSYGPVARTSVAVGRALRQRS